MARPFVVASRSNQYRVHYVRTSADSAASNISSDASTEIALIMLIKLVCLLIGPVKVPILVCPGRLPRYRSIWTLLPRQIKRDSQRRSIQYVVARSTFYITYSFGNNFRFAVTSPVYIARRILDSIELITTLRIAALR